MTAALSFFTTASVIIKVAKRDQPNEAADPMATRVSILLPPCRTARNPLTKNLRLMIMTQMAKSICTRAMATWLPTKKGGRGQPNIMCPMEKYMSTKRKPTELTRRRIILGVSRSLRRASS